VNGLRVLRDVVCVRNRCAIATQSDKMPRRSGAQKDKRLVAALPLRRFLAPDIDPVRGFLRRHKI